MDATGTRIASAEEPLVMAPNKWPLLPILDGVAPALYWKTSRVVGNVSYVNFESEASGPIDTLQLTLFRREFEVDLQCTFRVRKDVELNALDVFPPGTGLNFYDVVNFRNRHFSTATWPELLLGRECETMTFSNDWQFAPHPTALILRKNTLSIFAGFLDLQPSFGMRLNVKQSLVRQWDVDFGDSPNGWKLKAGETFSSGVLRLFLREGDTPYDLYREFGGMLIDEGRIPNPEEKAQSSWWKEPIYCTWGDQWMTAHHEPAVDLQDQTAGEAASAVEMLTEDRVLQAVEVIQREDLPVRTIILDDGWATARGDWRPHPERFPDLRRLVDALHAQGYKVMVWWNWAEIAKDAEVDESFLAESGWLNRHGNRWRDYSDPKVQDGYLKPLFRTLFSSDDGCYDLDGVKTDFLADKVHPDTPVVDPSWRGEERYFFKVTELFYSEMRKHKSDALHMGCAGHYWLAQFMGLNRTYDVHSSNWLEHEERAKMLLCTAPGVMASYDMMTCSENTGRWFDSAKRLGAGVEIGNVLYMRDTVFSEAEPATPAYLTMLRCKLEEASV